MREHIDVGEYCDALTTWGRLAQRPAAEVAMLQAACDEVRARFAGVVAIDALCGHLRRWARSGEPHVGTRISLDLSKSCLLDRLIYGGEKVRTRPCPVHRGVWSGCPPVPCAEGCNFGINVTGWLRNEPAGAAAGGHS